MRVKSKAKTHRSKTTNDGAPPRGDSLTEVNSAGEACGFDLAKGKTLGHPARKSGLAPFYEHEIRSLVTMEDDHPWALVDK